MIKRVIKRDGTKERWMISKVVNAIGKALDSVGVRDHRLAGSLAYVVQSKLSGFEEVSVEQIQDTVEDVLMKTYPDAARAFVRYRFKRQQLRELVNPLQLIQGYLDANDWRVNENSNIGYSLQGLNIFVSGETTSRFWLHALYSEKVANAHLKGKFHIHDLSLLAPYCAGWDLLDLLTRGFHAPGRITCNPPKHLRSALGQLLNFLYTMQLEFAGAVAVSSFDTLLAPFVYYDRLSYQEVYQCIQEFVYQLNVPTRVGAQTPFTNLTVDLGRSAYDDLPAVVAGKPVDEPYKKFRREALMICKALFEVLRDGDAGQRVFTFPIVTVNLTKDFDWDAPELEPLWEGEAKYGLYYFSNFISTGRDPDLVRSFCCRLTLDTSTLWRGGLFSSHPLTGSIGVVTINLPQIGYLAKGCSNPEEAFLQMLESRIELAAESLEVKRKTLERFMDKGLYPYSREYLRGVRQARGSWFANHYSTIGIVGMHEACLNLFGEGIESVRGREFALQVLKYILHQCHKLTEQTGHLYNLEATPAEGASYRLALLDSQQFDDIVQSGEGEEVYYTNSTFLPNSVEPDLYWMLRHQEPLQQCYNGGTVVHVWIGEKLKAKQAKLLVRRIAANFKIPYFTLTPTFSICPVHGYVAGEHWQCPQCGARTDVYSRVVGYLRPVSQWNKGKQREFHERHYVEGG